jgi:tetratricopeptide (TPR) repeat protein
MRTDPVALLLLLGTLAGCRAAGGGPASDGYPEPGPFHRAVSTGSAEAQKWFDRGLAYCYGFNHAEAIACFEKAAAADPDGPMPYWGIAFASGPHINNPAMDEAASKTAWEATQRALARRGRASPVEQTLIDAIGKRYVWPPPADRKEVDAAFAEAMREAWRRFPGDPDVGALFAEALMDLRPWDLWTLEGEPRPETPEVLATLQAVLRIDPDHPQALHLTIHALEASPHPERALSAADRLRHRLPGIGHMVHMPSHIDVLVGHYAEAVEANRRALAADRIHAARVGSKGLFAMYRAHNYHMLVFAAMFEGRSAEALAAARELVEETPDEVVREIPDFLEAFLAVPLHVLVRFGRWEDILREPAPAPGLPSVVAFRAYARTVALASLGRLAEAEASLADFQKAAAEVPESRYAGNNSVRSVLEVAKPMLEGEIAYRRREIDRAFEHLREAVKRDDALHYDEPRGWMQPPRHALGALLLEQGRAEEAEEVYRRDLKHHPDNGWSLHGLAECQRRLGRKEEAAKTDERLRSAWARADVQIYGSCFCRRRS